MTGSSSTPPATQGAKKPWETPALARIATSDAELGANPINPEGLAKGS
jgi:hypothetical protein